MLYALALLGLAAPFVSAIPQVTAAISPSTPAPSGCSYTYSGEFDLAKAVNGKRGLSKRQQGNDVQLSLENGVMQDPTGYTAYIASNYQFQFDKPPQAGAVYTAGFAICPNMTIALGGTAVFYQCTNGSGKFNIYYQQTTGLKCSPIFLEAIPLGSGASQVTTYPSQIPSYTPPATSSPVSTPAPVPSGGTGTGVVPPPSTSAPSTPTPPPANKGAVMTFGPEMVALAIGAIGAALL